MSMRTAHPASEAAGPRTAPGTVHRSTTSAVEPDDVPSPTSTPRVSVVVPAYNEARHLPGLLAAIPQDVHEVIVVDGNSVDDTVDAARSARSDVRVIVQNRTGKANALACGCASATGDVVVVMDADGSADPQLIPRFVAALVAGADFVTGTRGAAGGEGVIVQSSGSRSSLWLSRLANAMYGSSFTDLSCGYHAFWRRSLPLLNLSPGTGGSSTPRGAAVQIDTVVNVRMAKSGARITEIPVVDRSLAHARTRLDAMREGGRVLWALVTERLDPVAGGRPPR